MIFFVKGIGDLWIGVKRDKDEWYSGGKVFDSFKSNWLTGEPKNSTGADCAYLSKIHDYKMRTEGCKTPKRFLCMAQAPNCPDGYIWQPSYGAGKSCFRIRGPVNFEFNTANKICMKDNTRLATLQSLEDQDSVTNWLISTENTKDVFTTGVRKDLFLGVFRYAVDSDYLQVDRYSVFFQSSDESLFFSI